MRNRSRLWLATGACLVVAAWMAWSVLSEAPRAGAGVDAAAKRDAATTVIVVRHAEKAGGGGDVSLTAAGRKRAERLATILSRAGVDVLVSSDRRRTRETLEPLARSTGLEILSHSRPRSVAAAIEQLPVGSTVVVAHHSDTIHAILGALGVPPRRAASVRTGVYDNLLVLTLHADCPAHLVELVY